MLTNNPSVLCEQPTQEDYADGLLKHQLVMEFDMETWRVRTPPLSVALDALTDHRTRLVQRAIEVFDIKEAMIPQRPKSEMRIGQKWYG